MYPVKAVIVLLLSIVLVAAMAGDDFGSSFTPAHMRYLRNETKKLFDHAWSAYMEHGFPADEVTPITCEPYGPDYDDVDDLVRNDAMGNVSLTILDNIDSLIIMEKWDDLEDTLQYLKQEMDSLFNKTTIVQVFEATIRLLGGLLSSHLLLTDINQQFLPARYDRFRQISDDYNGFLLSMAHDLGLRLIPAFKTSTNIPVPRVNLSSGLYDVPARLQKETCLSGATTPFLEFTLLSRLTGDPQFEYYTQLTFWKLWSSKLELDLLPMTLDPIANEWLDSITGVGASVDSFYEYAAKGSIIFDDDYLWSVFKTSYKALLIHLAQGGGQHDGSMIFANVNTKSGTVASTWIDSLGAFWSGLQVLTGHLSDAVKTHTVYLKLWDHFSLIPERWNHVSNGNFKSYAAKLENAIPLEWYPLRPEFIESTYYLYRATKDPMYLQIGARILQQLMTTFKAECGLNGIQDIRKGYSQDRMESFVMSETLKYLYLLFDTENDVFIHNTNVMAGKSWVFSTEAHPLWFHKGLQADVKVLNQSDLFDLSHINTKDSLLLIESLLSKIGKSVGKDHNKIADAKTTFFRNITTSKVTKYWFSASEKYPYLEVVDALESRFNHCETKPDMAKDNSRDFMSTNYYKWDVLFQGDYDFRDTLIRPKYLGAKSNDGSYIELSPQFYDKFTMFSGDDNHLQCRRPMTTTVYDLFLGEREKITQSQVSTVKHNTKFNPAIHTELPVLAGDLWVPIISSLRLKIETLEVGKVDSHNKVITESYIQSLRPDDFNAETGMCKKTDAKNAHRINQALRILKVNGVNVPPGLVIWTSPFDVLDDEEPVLDVGSDARVHLQGKVIENLVVWYD